MQISLLFDILLFHLAKELKMETVTVVKTVTVVAEASEVLATAAEFCAALGPAGIVTAIGVAVFVGGIVLAKQLTNSGESKNNEKCKKKQEHQNETTKRTKTTNSEKTNASAGSGSADDPNDRNNRGNEKKSNDQTDTDLSEFSDTSDEYDFTSTESVEIIVSSDSNFESKEHKKRNIRYKNPQGRSYRLKSIRKHFKGQGSHFEIDHAPSLAIIKKLLIKIKSFDGKRVPNHLKRVIKMLKIFFKTNNLQTLYDDINNLREKKGSILFSILVIKSVHRAQESTGNSSRQEAYTNEVVHLFLQGNIEKAFKRIFQDYYNTIMDQIKTLDKESVETQFDWIKNFIDYLFRRQIITEDEKVSLIDFINWQKNSCLTEFLKKRF